MENLVQHAKDWAASKGEAFTVKKVVRAREAIIEGSQNAMTRGFACMGIGVGVFGLDWDGRLDLWKEGIHDEDLIIADSRGEDGIRARFVTRQARDRGRKIRY